MTMIDTEAFIKSSPFRLSHNDSSSTYNLSNTTPDLLKFQLQEQYRNKLSENDSDSKKFPSTQFLDDSFNVHLQSNLDSGNITLSESLPSLTDSEDFEIDTFILNKSNNPTYLNLKVLIENSILDTSKINKDSILSLGTLKNLKELIEEKNDLKHYLVSKVGISQLFISTIIGEEDVEDDGIIDAKLLMKILKLNTSLQDQLLKVNNELDELNLKLNNHNMACLVLGYVEDVKLSIRTNSGVSSDLFDTPLSSPRKSPQKKFSTDLLIKQFDSLFSHIVSLAVQHNITLPPPPSVSDPESIEARTKWAHQCIDSVLLNRNGTADSTIDMSLSSPTSTASKSEPTNFQDTSFFSSGASLKSNTLAVNERILTEYKTALNDLRFSHQFLTKEYELSRDSSMKIIHDYRKKISSLDKELAFVKSSNLSVDHQSVSKSSSMTSLNEDSITSKDKEISRLRKELNLLRIEKLGKKAPSPVEALSSPPASLVNNFQHHMNTSADALSVPGDLEEDDALINSASTRPTSITGYSSLAGGMSNGILRKEFKKIVSEMHDQYDVELSEERIKRRNLQQELDKLKGI